MTLCSLRSRLLISAHVLLLGDAMAACGGDPPPDRTDSGTPPGDGSIPGVDGGGGGGGDAGDAGGGGRMCGVAGGACDVIRQDCPSPQACYYVASMPGGTPSTMCISVNMTGGDGATCEFVNDCLPGFTCNGGVCRHYCCMGSSSDCPAGMGQFCVGLAGAGEIGQCTASATCTLVAPQTGCPTGQGCYIAADDGTLGCFGAGDLAEGAACENLNSCMPGTACLSMAGGSGACTKFCRIDMGEADCSAGRTCMAAGLTLPTGVGICPPPT
jgi:hypothetical protein